MHTLTGASVPQEVRAAACLLAREHFHRLRPGSTDRAARDWAGRHWRWFRGRAVDFLAAVYAAREKAGGRPCPPRSL